MPALKSNTTYLTTSKAAKYIGISPTSLRRLEAENRIKAERQNNGYRVFSIEELNQLKESLNKNKNKIHEQRSTNLPSFTTSKAAKHLGVSPTTLRRLETEGKVKPVRDKNNHRIYTAEQIVELKSEINEGFSKHQTNVLKEKVKILQQNHAIIQKASFAGGIVIAGFLFILGISVFGTQNRKIDEKVLSSTRIFADAVSETIDEQKDLLGSVLGERDRPTEFWFYVNVPTNIGSELVVEGDATFAGNISTPGVDLLGTGTLAGLAGIDATSATTLQNNINIGGDLTGTLANTTLAETLEYEGELTVTNIFNITGELQADGDSGSDEQVLTSTGDSVEWLDVTDLLGDLTDAETLDSIDSTEFLRSNTSDAFTSGTLSFSDGTFLDLSSIAQDDSAAQGLKLPQSASLVAPASGEGYLAYDSSANKIQIYNGFAWVDVTGASNSLQNAYEYGNTIQLSASEGDITIRNDTNDQMMFFDEDTARVGIGTISPQYKLDVSGDVRVANSSDIYLEGEALRSAQLGNRTYTYDAFVTDGETMTASINALDTQVRNLTLGTAGLWTDAGTVTYMTSDVDDLVIGGTTLASSVFGIDESTGTFYYGADGSVNPSFVFEAIGGDVGTFGFNGNDAFYITGANLGIGKVDPAYALDINGEFNATTIYINGTAVSSTATELNILDGTTISTSELNLLTGRTGTLVDSNNVGSYATTSVDAGAGLTDGGGVGSVTVNVGAGSGINVTADAVALGDLTSSWVQSAAYDITLNNANSELKILESVGGTYFGIMDITDLNADRTYTFPDASGNILVTSSASTELSGWDQDVSDDLTGTGANGQVSYWTGTYSQAGSNDFYWDNGNSRLGIGTTAPAASLELPGAAAGYSSLRINTGSQPSSPAVGDIYAAGTALYFYDGSTWNDLTSSAGASLFTDGGTVTYLTATSDDFAIGGTTLAASMFGIDESAGTFYFGADNSANPTFEFEATDSDTGTFGFNTNDAFYFSDANVGIGTTNPTNALHVYGNLVVNKDGAGSNYGFIARGENGSGQYMGMLSSGLSIIDQNWTNSLRISNYGSYTQIYSDAGNALALQISGGNIGVGTTNPTDALHVVGNTLSTAGYHVGTDSTDSLIDDASNGSGSSTLYIGNESILASGDIGSSVQSYNANTSLIGQTIETSEITDDTILEVDFDATNSPTAGYILSYDSVSGGFTWIANTGGSGASKWTDSGAFTYLTGTTDDVVFGDSDTTDAPFWFDVSTSDIVLGGANTANGFETTIDVTDPSADRTITLPDSSGELSLLGQTISGSEIVDNTIEEVDLELTNSPTDNYILSYDLASGGFTWINPTGSGVGSLGGGGTSNYLTKWTDPSTLGDSVIYETGGSLGIGTTAPASVLHISEAAPVFTASSTNGNSGLQINITDLDADTDYLTRFQDEGTTVAAIMRNGDFVVNGASPLGSDAFAGDATLTIDADAGSRERLIFAKVADADSYFTVFNTTSSANQFLPMFAGYHPNTQDRTGLIFHAAVPNSGSKPALSFRATSNDYSTATSGRPIAAFAAGSGGNTAKFMIWPDGKVNIGDNVGGIETSNTAPNYQVKIQTTGTTDILGLYETSGASVFEVEESGDVGIGVTNPSYKLDIAGTLNATGQVSFSGLATGTDNSVIVLNSSNQLVTDEIDTRVWGSTLLDTSGSANYIQLVSDSNTLANSSLYETGGLIGLGTTAPSTALDVVGSGTFSARLQANTIGIGTGSDAFLDIKAATLSSAQINLTSSSGTDVSTPVNGDFWWNGTNLYFYDGSTNTDLLAGGGTFDGTGVANYITKFTDVDTLTTSAMYEVGGQIGIGTTAPSSTFDVVGSVTASTSIITPLISFTGTGTINGLDAVDSTTENTIEGLIFDADAENILGAWEVQDQITFSFGNEADIQFMYDETTDDRLEISDGTNDFLTIADAGTSATVQINTDDIYVKSDGLVGIGTTDPTQQLDINGDLRIRGGDIYLDPQSTSTATTEGAIYYDDDVDHLYVYGGDSAFHRIALDMTKYTATNSSVSNQSYVQIQHNQSTNDLTVVGWFYDTIDSLWKKIASTDTTLSYDLDNEFNAEHTQKQKFSSAELKYNIDNSGNGADGAIAPGAGTYSLNTTNFISGRSCADGGDAVNYSVTGLTSTTATLESSPSAGCLAVGDEVLLINLRGTNSATVNVGNYETFRIQSITTNTVTFTTSKTKYYGDGASNDTNIGVGTGAQAVMLQRVPNYTNVTVAAGVTMTPDDFVSPSGAVNNGAGEGGVLFFRATGTVSVGGSLNANGKGYNGGAASYTASGGTIYGGNGGESFCGPGGARGNSSASNGAAGGGSQTGTPGSGYCGGGGASASAGGTGSAASGGSGGGGAGHGAGGAGGYGTAGSASSYGAAGGTNQSANGTVSGNQGAGGSGGTYGSANLTDLLFGSSGGSGGAWSNNGTTSGAGGDGGGIVYVAANTVSVSGSLASNGGSGGNAQTGLTRYAGGGGGGAGGSVKIVGASLTLGSSLVTASSGSGGLGVANGSAGSYNGGTGGAGRIAIGYTSSISGSSSPAYTTLTTGYNPYAVYVSEEVHTPDATALNTISWTESLPSGTEIQLQTRSGATEDSTDGTWEAWKPTTSSATLETANTHTNFTGSNATVAEGDVARNVKYFEDEDESNSTNLTKVTATSANGYAEATISSTNISSYDFITFWVYSSAAGETVKIGFGETAGSEQEQTIHIDQIDTWQKVYWDISDVTGTARDGVTKIRVTVPTSGHVVRFDNIKAESYLTTSGGSTITSTANEYVQYRAILATTNTANSPTFSKVEINYTNPNDTYDIDADSIVDPNAKIANQTSEKIDPLTIEYAMYSNGNGADGAIAPGAGTYSLNTTNFISGRSCTDGGDAVNYSVTGLTSNTATLESSPSTGCLAAGDEVLLINLRGTNSATVNVGNYETFRIQSIVSNTVTFTTSKTKYYGDGASNDTNIGVGTTAQAVMLQRVPNYTNVTVAAGVTVTPDDFVSPNGAVNNGAGEGGVLFFRATGTVSVGGSLNANGKGYNGGAASYTASGGTIYGGNGGESFCGAGGARAGGGGTGGNGAAGGGTQTGTAGNGYCGGGGGASGVAGTGSAASGGSGGGGGPHGAGGAGGYGTAGAASSAGAAGGTNQSANGTVSGNGGAGGSGGTYGDTILTDLLFGSSGGSGGAWSNNGTTSGAGGDGGGIVYVAANTVSVSGSLASNGGSGGNAQTGLSRYAGGGGGGAGGSVKIVGASLTLGSSKVTTSSGAGGLGVANGSAGSYNGGAGGQGRIAIYYSSSVSGSSAPSYTVDTTVGNYNSYKVYTSKEISTSGAVSFGNIEWSENLASNTEVQVQTRSGNSSNSTDGTWEAWKPTTSSTTLETANTHTNWTGSNMTVADGDVTRNIDYFEDEDESTAGNITKLTSTAAGGYAEATISSTNISSRDYLTMWIRSSIAGSSITLGIGEAAATEQTETIYIEQSNVWQKVYWDISDITGTARDGITKLRVTSSPNSNTIYIDNLKAESYLTTPGGSTITSTANNYVQYRAILSTTNVANSPTFSEVRINYTDGSGAQVVSDRLINQNIVDEHYNDTRLLVNNIELDDYKSINIKKQETGITLDALTENGNGKDGNVTISSNTDINVVNNISGRSCADGGDAVNYSITTLNSRSAQLNQAPSSGCLAIGDEVLIINLQGTYSAHYNVGNWETLLVESITGNTVNFKTAKTKYYGDGRTDDTNIGTSYGTQRVMLQRVPNYDNLVVNDGVSFYPTTWNGVRGGVIFFKAKTAASINGTVHANARGYAGGAGSYVASGGTIYGGNGGEAFCGAGGSRGSSAGGSGAAGGGAGNPGTGGSSYCGGTGGSYTTSPGSILTTNGGAGGGGGAHYGGGGGGYGTFGYGYSNGGTNQSGTGGTAGGGGGTYNEPSLEKLMFGSAGGSGGTWQNDGTTSGAGGNGGGIVLIMSDAVTVSGGVTSNGASGGNAQTGLSRYAGGGGGGAGGSIKLIGNNINVGTSKTLASGGSGGLGVAGGSAGTYNGYAGGQGRIAVIYGTNISGTSTPSYNATQTFINKYAVFTSDVIETPDATSLARVTWNADETTHGTVQVQVRTGLSNNATDGIWEAWKPVVNGTNYVDLETANTHTNWASSSSTTTIADGDITRDVNYFENEDESTAGNLTKMTVGANSNTYAEARINAKDLSNYDFITAWVYSTSSGNTVKLGFGETDSNEHEAVVKLDSGSTWQKVYWDIAHIPTHERDEVRNLRITGTSNSYTIYFDNIKAERLMTDPSGSIVKSTPNEYLQYRVVLTSADPGYSPTLYSLQITWENGYKIVQEDSNTVRLYNYTGETQNLRFEAIVFGADLAEWYTVDNDNIGPGDLVALTGELDEYGVPILRKASAEDANLIGGISTKAGKELGLEAEDRRLLALAGRIPVKIDPDSEEILPGDSITASDIPGYGRKAALGERAMGTALEKWEPGSIDTEDNKILTLVAPAYTVGTQETAETVLSLEDKVNRISSLLGLESGTEAPGIAAMAEKINSAYDDFVRFTESLGLSTTTDENGESVLAVNSDMTVTGKTSLSSVAVLDTLTVGLLEIDATTNEVNILGASCYNEDTKVHNEVLCEAQSLNLQADRTGNINLFDGMIVMEPDGTLNIHKLAIKTDKETYPSAGQITLSPGVTSIEIKANITDNSLILLTPDIPVTIGKTIVNDNTFEITMKESQTKEIKVDWLIVELD